MTKRPFHDDAGKPIDSHFEVQSNELILHSRGGAKGSPAARNTQYNWALRMLIERIQRSELALVGVRVDSTPAQSLPAKQREILFPDDAEGGSARALTKVQEENGGSWPIAACQSWSRQFYETTSLFVCRRRIRREDCTGSWPG